MLTTAFVNLWNTRFGAVAWNLETGVAAFEYEGAFLKKNWPLAPLEMPAASAARRIFSFPELRDSNTFKGLPGLLADALPDKYGHTLI